MSTPDIVIATRVWNGLRTLVVDLHDKRNEVCEALGMSFVRAKALRRLARGPRTMRELAAELSTDASYTTLVVDDLEKRGLVGRTVDPGDRRAKIVTATPAGLAAAELAERILGEPPASLLDLAGTELETLDRIVTTLLARHDA